MCLGYEGFNDAKTYLVLLVDHLADSLMMCATVLTNLPNSTPSCQHAERVAPAHLGRNLQRVHPE